MNLNRTRSTLLFLTATMLASLTPRAAGADYYAYIGDNESGAGKGIFLAHFDTIAGVMTKPVLQVEVATPSFFVLSADGLHLYSVAEGGQGEVRAYAVNSKTGGLKFINSMPAASSIPSGVSGGAGPCHVALDATGKYLAAANYGSGSVSVFAVNADGSIGKSIYFDQHAGGPTNRGGPHAHCVVFAPGNKFLLNCDLGQDRVYVYKFDEKTGTIVPNDPAYASIKAGSGPRHLLFAPNGKVVYVTNEIGNTVVAMNWDADKGTLTQFQSISTMAPGQPAPGTSTDFTNAELAIGPQGHFLYASVRDVAVPSQGRDHVTSFSIDGSGKLTKIEDVTVGQVPRFITIDPSAKWLLAGSQEGNDLRVFGRDPNTGKLTAKGAPLSTPKPVCIKFLLVPAAK